MTDLSGAAARHRPRRRWALYLPYLVLVIIALAWSAIWFVARDRVKLALDTWVAREAELGRHWECPDREVSGFPFRFEIVCEKPSFAGLTPHGRVEGQVARFVAVSQVYDPSLVIASVQGPLTVRAVDTGEALSANWSAADASVRLRQRGFERLSLVARDLAASHSAGGAAVELGRAAGLELHVREDPDRPAQEHAYDVVGRFAGAAVPALDAQLRTNDRADIEIQATVTRGDVFGRGKPAEQLERWREASGRLDIVLLSFAKGPQRLSAKGTLSLDAQHRPQGQIDASAAGLGDLVRTLGGNAGGVSGLIAGGLDFFAGRARGRAEAGGATAPGASSPGASSPGASPPGSPPAGPGGDAPALAPLPPLLLADGRVSMGPIVLLALKPLY